MARTRFILISNARTDRRTRTFLVGRYRRTTASNSRARLAPQTNNGRASMARSRRVIQSSIIQGPEHASTADSRWRIREATTVGCRWWRCCIISRKVFDDNAGMLLQHLTAKRKSAAEWSLQVDVRYQSVAFLAIKDRHMVALGGNQTLGSEPLHHPRHSEAIGDDFCPISAGMLESRVAP